MPLQCSALDARKMAVCDGSSWSAGSAIVVLDIVSLWYDRRLEFRLNRRYCLELAQTNVFIFYERVRRRYRQYRTCCSLRVLIFLIVADVAQRAGSYVTAIIGCTFHLV